MQFGKSVLILVALLASHSLYAADPVFGSDKETRFARGLKPPKGKAIVYIYERQQDGDVATPTIWLNKYKIGRIVPGSFTVWQLAPGQLNLRVDGLNPATLSVLSQAGRVYLFRISVTKTGKGLQAQIENLPDTYRGDLMATRLIKNPRQVTAAMVQAPAKTATAPIVSTAPVESKPQASRRHEDARKVHVRQRPGGYGVMLKLGTFSVSNQTQNIIGSDRAFDKSASGVFALEVYKQSASGLAYGGELVNYKLHFTTVGDSTSGDISALVGLANARQYYRTDTEIQPYLGIGIGYAFTDSSGTAFSGNTAGFAYQLVGGVEYRTSNMGFFAEYKYLGAKTKDSIGNTIDATGSGFFAGMALHF